MQARNSKTSNSNSKSSSHSMNTKWRPFSSKWPMTSSTSLSPTTSKSPPWTLNPPTSRSSAPISSSRDPQLSSSLSSKNKSTNPWPCQVRWVRCKISTRSSINRPRLLSHIRELALREDSSLLTSGFNSSSNSNSRWLQLTMRVTLAICRSHSSSRLRWLGRLRSNSLRSWRRRSSSSNSSSNRSSSSSWCSRLITVRRGSRLRITTLSLWMTVMLMSNSIRVWKRVSKASLTIREESSKNQWMYKRVFLKLSKTTTKKRKATRKTSSEKINYKKMKSRKLKRTKSQFVNCKPSNRNSRLTLT